MVDYQRQNVEPAAAHAASQMVIGVRDPVDPQWHTPVRCDACRCTFAADEFANADIELLNDRLTLHEWKAGLTHLKAFKPLCERYPVLIELTRVTYGRPIPIPPKLSVALSERVGHALTNEECEVLDRPSNRWFDPYWLHDLATHVDKLIDQYSRQVSERAESLAEKRVLCPNCSQDALVIEEHIVFLNDFDDC